MLRCSQLVYACPSPLRAHWVLLPSSRDVFSQCDLSYNIKYPVMKCIRLFYFPSLCWNVYKGLSVFYNWSAFAWTFEGVLIGLRPKSLYWPNFSLCTVLASSSLVHCPHAVRVFVLTSVHIWTCRPCHETLSSCLWTYILLSYQEHVLHLCLHTSHVSVSLGHSIAKMNCWQEVLCVMYSLKPWGLQAVYATRVCGMRAYWRTLSSSTWLLAKRYRGRAYQNSNQTKRKLKVFSHLLYLIWSSGPWFGRKQNRICERYNKPRSRPSNCCWGYGLKSSVHVISVQIIPSHRFIEQ